MYIFIKLFPKSLKSHRVFTKISKSTGETNKNTNENAPVTKVKNSKSKEPYTYIKFHLDLSIRNLPKWRGGCGIYSHIISNNNYYFVSGYVNSVLFIRFSISSCLK